MKTLSITIEEPLLKGLDQQIEEYSYAGRSEAVRQAIREWIARRNLKKKIQKEIVAYRKKPVQKDEFDLLISQQELLK